MAIATCLDCGKDILTEADPYMVFPHSTGYHIFCCTCATAFGNDSVRYMYNKILQKKGQSNGKTKRQQE